MAIVLGPVLGFRGEVEGRWQIGALVVAEGGEPPLVVWKDGVGAAGPVLLAENRGRTVWRFDVEVERGAADTVVRYEVEGVGWSFTVPAAATMPRMAYTSCNGFSSLKLLKSVADKNAMWKVMAERHAVAPIHLLLMGGDQVYADEMWETVEPLKRWSELPAGKAQKAAFGSNLETRVRDFYFDLYCRRWSQPEIRAMLATVPTLMMWDDHDIFDGWGSYSPKRHDCPVFQGIFRLAREHFRIFQRQEDGAAPPAAALFPEGGFTVAHRLGDLALLALDMRSERTVDQVLSPAHWQAVYDWTGSLVGPAHCRHLLVMSSIPVVHPSFETVARVLCTVPGSQELEDDLKDHWCSRHHRGERLRLIHRLFDFAEEQGTRVTLLSGDVHVGALGVLQSVRRQDGNSLVINQLTSSGIVHPAPPALMLFALDHLFREKEEVDRGIAAEMAMFPGTQHRFLGARNWLSLEPDAPSHHAEGRLWAQWIVEGVRDPYTKVIHPVE